MTVLCLIDVENQKRKLIQCSCDQCGKIFSTRFFKGKFENKIKLTFCCQDCMNKSKKKGGKLNSQFKLTCLARYGVENPFQSEDKKEKSKKTCLKNYGVEHSMQSKEIQKKRKETYLENYGVDHPFKSDEIKNNAKQTCIKRYGVDYTSKLKENRAKIDYKLASLRCHETMKRNGTYRKSNVEDKFYKFLCEKFDEENVERQVRVHKWNIDFYVKSIDTYIQFDGVYWHGLDRPIEDIKEFKSPRDKVIFETFLRDQEQNKWFKENQLKLVRVIDKNLLNYLNLNRLLENEYGGPTISDILEIL